MSRTCRWALAVALLAAAPAWSAGPKYSIKAVDAEPPKAVKEPIRKLLGNQSIQLLDAQGKVLCQLWFRKDLPADTAKEGMTYRDLPETTLFGAVKFDQPATDYRKQKIKPGVYTLRLGFQPMDGDHMGVSPYTEFLLAVPAMRDSSPALIKPKGLYERSSRSVGTSHPAVLMLVPDQKAPDKPQLVSKEANSWVLNLKEEVTGGGKKAPLGVGLMLIGSAEQ